MLSTHVIVIDLVGLLFALVGFHMAFRQRLVRRWYRTARPRDPTKPAQFRPAGDADEDPAHYALIIFGMMILAFGVILIFFTTAYALLAR